MTNSFWREVIDHIPGLVMLFRVDENEDAHLIFVNSEVRNILGYTPEEYVLASESADSAVKSEISLLVEKIAELSHDGVSDAEPICRLHSKRAAEYSFSFEFRIFSVKSSPLPFIAVSLEPSRQKAKTEEKRGVDQVGDVAEEGDVFFVNESPLMKSLMRKVDLVTDQQVHLLFRGEYGTGKRTLAAQVLHAEKFGGAETLIWDIPAMSASRQDEAVEKLCGDSTKYAANPGKLALLMIEVSKLNLRNQHKLLEWLRGCSDSGRSIRILATTQTLLEEQMNRGKFSMELYYYLGFDSILLPPISQRKEDIRALVDKWIPNAAKALGIGEIHVDDQVKERLLSLEWPQNFHDLYKVLRRSLLYSEKGAFRLSLDSVDGEKENKMKSKEVDSDLSEVIPFDEMSRRYLQQVLNKTEGKIYGQGGAAQLLDMKPTTLQSKLKKLGVR